MMLPVAILCLVLFIVWPLLAMCSDRFVPKSSGSDYFWPVLFFVLAMGATCSAEIVTVTRVIDGDTFDIKDGYRVRIQGIDTPERRQPHGGDAWMLLHSWLHGKQVELRNIQPAAWNRQSAIVVYQRRDIGLELVRRGLAYVDTRYVDSDVQAAYERGFSEAQREQRGIWAVPVPPWEWRKKKTTTLANVPSESRSAVAVSPAVNTPSVWRQVTLYWTNGCAPCERIKPEFLRLRQELEGRGYTFHTTGNVADAFHARIRPPYPWIVVTENGREVKRFQGYATAQTLRNWITGRQQRVQQRVQQQHTTTGVRSAGVTGST